MFTDNPVLLGGILIGVGICLAVIIYQIFDGFKVSKGVHEPLVDAAYKKEGSRRCPLDKELMFKKVVDHNSIDNCPQCGSFLSKKSPVFYEDHGEEEPFTLKAQIIDFNLTPEGEKIEKKR